MGYFLSKEAANEISNLKNRLKKEKGEFDRIVQKAQSIVKDAFDKECEIVLVVGAPGAGKSTICKYLYNIEGAEPGESPGHVTKTMTLHEANDSSRLKFVDSIGKVPDMRGIMRVIIACAYNHGWDPVAMIVVQAGRTGVYSKVTSYLQISPINVITFEPRSFWKIVGSGMDPKAALEMTIFPDKNHQVHSPVNVLSVGNAEPKECHITQNLLCALAELTYESDRVANEDVGIANALSYYMAKCITDRSEFNGDDLLFIDRPFT